MSRNKINRFLNLFKLLLCYYLLIMTTKCKISLLNTYFNNIDDINIIFIIIIVVFKS